MGVRDEPSPYCGLPPPSYSTSEDEKSLVQWPPKPGESGKASSGPLAKF